MRHGVVFFVLGLLSVTILSGCSGSGTPATTLPPPTIAQMRLSGSLVISLTEQSNRIGSFVGLHDTLRISLPVKKGVVWQLTDPVGPVLQQISPPSAAPGTQVLAFRGVKTGEVTVRLRNNAGGKWYSVVDVWTINLSPENFAPARPGIKSTTTTSKH
jgi:hypothetical protein